MPVLRQIATCTAPQPTVIERRSPRKGRDIDYRVEPAGRCLVPRVEPGPHFLAVRQHHRHGAGSRIGRGRRLWHASTVGRRSWRAADAGGLLLDVESLAFPLSQQCVVTVDGALGCGGEVDVAG